MTRREDKEARKLLDRTESPPERESVVILVNGLIITVPPEVVRVEISKRPSRFSDRPDELLVRAEGVEGIPLEDVHVRRV